MLRRARLWVGFGTNSLLAEAVHHHRVFAKAKTDFNGTRRGHGGDKRAVRELSLGFSELKKKTN